MGGRLIEDIHSGGEAAAVHWAPIGAEAWSCVECHRSWRLVDSEWQPWGWPAQTAEAVAVVVEEAVMERPKVPVCRECGKALDRLDKQGRIAAHADWRDETDNKVMGRKSCRGRGYMPRWT